MRGSLIWCTRCDAVQRADRLAVSHGKGIRRTYVNVCRHCLSSYYTLPPQAVGARRRRRTLERSGQKVLVA